MASEKPSRRLPPWQYRVVFEMSVLTLLALVGAWRLFFPGNASAWVSPWALAGIGLGLLAAGAGATAGLLSRCRGLQVKRASQRMIEESEGRLRAILGAVQAAIVTIDAETHVIVDANPAAVQMIGETREKVIGAACQGFICPAQPGHCPVLDDGPGYMNNEQDVLLRRGVEIPVLKTVTPIYLDGRKHLLHSFVNISALKRAEEQVSIFRRCVEASGQGFGMATLDGEITYVNPTLWALLGLERQEDLHHQPFVKFYPPELVPRFVREILPAIMRQGQWTGEMLLVSRTGGRIPTIDHFFLIRDENGNPHRLGFAITDITAQRDVTEKLRRAREEAEAANRSKSEFLANMSHEIRTPMNAIIGMTDLALDTDLTAEQEDYLKTVKMSAGALLRLINDILDFSKIEAGKLDLSPIVFDLRDCVEDTMRTLAPRAGEKGLELTCRIHPSVPEAIFGDPGRLRQILINLVGNSIKFTEVGEIVVDVKTEEESNGAIHLRFSVRDTGVGVPEEKQAIVFDSFSQADGSTTRTYGGTGLGLAICRQLVSMMNGTIWVESPAAASGEAPAGGGPGSVFHFTAWFGKRQPLPKVRRATPNELLNLPVLIVDDNTTNRRMLVEMLTNWRMKPVAAENGDKAMELMRTAAAAQAPYRIVLLDSQMPDINGFDLAQRLRGLSEQGQTTFMLLTSSGNRGDAARCQEMGIAAYLLKPVVQSELFDAILTIIGIPEDVEAPLITRHLLRSQAEPLRILLAEDNPVNQRLAVALLEKRGHRVDVAETGKEVLRRLEQEDYDLVLMDIQMPEMDGLQATRQIRGSASSVRNHDIPIIAMTAHAMEGDKERCLASGMNDYIAKPIQTESLLEKIEKVLLGPNRRDTGRRAIKMQGPGVFDEFSILRNVDGDADLLREVVGVFMESYPVTVSQIERAVEAGDAAGLERAAHSLKGSVNAFGAQAAYNAALVLERMGREGQLGSASDACGKLSRELERLRIALARRFMGEEAG